MLVLSRNVNECIVIGDDIKVMIVDIRGDKVRLGISAPTAVTVHREEVYEAIKSGGRKPIVPKPTHQLEEIRTNERGELL